MPWVSPGRITILCPPSRGPTPFGVKAKFVNSRPIEREEAALALDGLRAGDPRQRERLVRRRRDDRAGRAGRVGKRRLRQALLAPDELLAGRIDADVRELTRVVGVVVRDAAPVVAATRAWPRRRRRSSRARADRSGIRAPAGRAPRARASRCSRRAGGCRPPPGSCRGTDRREFAGWISAASVWQSTAATSSARHSIRIDGGEPSLRSCLLKLRRYQAVQGRHCSTRSSHPLDALIAARRRLNSTAAVQSSTFRLGHAADQEDVGPGDERLGRAGMLERRLRAVDALVPVRGPRRLRGVVRERAGREHEQKRGEDRRESHGRSGRSLSDRAFSRADRASGRPWSARA